MIRDKVEKIRRIVIFAVYPDCNNLDEIAQKESEMGNKMFIGMSRLKSSLVLSMTRLTVDRIVYALNKECGRLKRGTKEKDNIIFITNGQSIYRLYDDQYYPHFEEICHWLPFETLEEQSNHTIEEIFNLFYEERV